MCRECLAGRFSSQLLSGQADEVRARAAALLEAQGELGEGAGLEDELDPSLEQYFISKQWLQGAREALCMCVCVCAFVAGWTEGGWGGRRGGEGRMMGLPARQPAHACVLQLSASWQWLQRGRMRWGGAGRGGLWDRMARGRKSLEGGIEHRMGATVSYERHVCVPLTPLAVL